MPKGHRPARSQGYYRLNPAPTTPTTATQYAPLSSRPSLASLESLNTYYTTPSGTLTSNMSQQQYSSQPQQGYPNGGPVQPIQHPMSQQQHSYSQMAQQQAQQQPPQASIRASSGAWNPQDDATLMAARAQGMNWAPIQQAYFPSKTPNACRKRHERLMERRSADDWDGMKIESMAKQYMALRREIWTPLAAATGEKWNVVEQKCMSQGLKNLQTSARSCARRERILDSSSTTHSQLSTSQPSSAPPYPVQSHTFGEHHTDDSGYADEIEQEYDAASDRSGSLYQEQVPAHGHSYSQSGGSTGSLGMGNMGGGGMSGGMGGGMVDLRGVGMGYAQHPHQSRLPIVESLKEVGNYFILFRVKDIEKAYGV
ncbi:uncharacterized protein PAC_16521 [Phialocephala subalpina]|uniref:Myb-like domain-containing protein n=1 Tax=Phialocephala subalpina TaxID=576137 RepID=A0A1L7XNI2_9HELO|nr:uncharacterized protein PAC_16521 [Phialocephala subalpina]